ncbi:Crp/Fnr family transcriptional regulator [Paenibacillus filicis]|uniref:Crp/Fnr family transcriptional regulator n=1 Tax=Paenibacillus gyeongsangnamensis TaxID=3388067 RepID=A0ABT4QK68_9BACL|nr:Crp/Fnr family transcriptional regulator [Paenibacillus filicis]MCZ8517192.1 Crp/Fnr family transcriptional regulator [Paenibacillus filicis]
MSADTINKLMNKHHWLHDMLSQMPPDLFNQWDIRNYKPHDMVCEQGRMSEYFYIVIEGEFKVQHTLDDGHLVIMAYLYPGELISDIEIALGQAYVCSVIATTKGVALALKADVYRKWIARDNHFLILLNAQLSNKLYGASQKTIDQMSMSIRHRLIRYFYKKLEHFDFNEHIACITPFSREDIASEWGVTVRSINRILKDLKDRRVIFVKKNQIIFNEWSRYLIEKELAELENK